MIGVRSPVFFKQIPRRKYSLKRFSHLTLWLLERGVLVTCVLSNFSGDIQIITLDRLDYISTENIRAYGRTFAEIMDSSTFSSTTFFDTTGDLL